MQQQDPVVAIAILLAAALVGGMIAHRLKQPIILGYLVIGIAIGPHALGFVEDLEIIEAVAIIGVALLMFTLGLEISISQLREVGKLGIWGGIIQILVTFSLGLVIGFTLFNWPIQQAMLFGLIISLSSTVVCLKLLMDRGELSSVQGKIMLSILILQDIAVVLMMIAIPLMGGELKDLPLELAMALGKSVLFIGLTIILGRWIVPWLLGNIGGVRARELFLLTVLVLSLGTAVGTHIFGLSVVFGAFLVGLVLRETRFVHQALAEITPLRDVFATLFFVSLGMLLDPVFLINNWMLVLSVVAVIILLKSVVVFSIVKIFGHSNRIALITGAGLFQIGEFGFILAQSGIDTGIVTSQFYSVIISAAIITMLLTPLSMGLFSRFYPTLTSRLVSRKTTDNEIVTSQVPYQLEVPNRVVIAGYGRVGQNVAQGLQDAGISYLIIDIDPKRVSEAKASGRSRMYGDASNIHVLSHAGLDKARALVITYPDSIAVITTARLALTINPELNILARVHRIREADELKKLGVTELISPEYEASYRFIKRLLHIMDLQSGDRKRILKLIRKDKEIAEFNPDQF
jgi:CPA2 family monovalent cation:H+ antiporter-2